MPKRGGFYFVIVHVPPSAFLSVFLISGKQSASLLISTVIDWSAARYTAFPMGRYQGQMQRALTLGEKGHVAELSSQELRHTSKIIEGINHTAARLGHFSWSAVLLARWRRLCGRPVFSIKGTSVETDSQRQIGKLVGYYSTWAHSW